MSLSCPTCGQRDLDPAAHRGLVINRRAYLRSQLIGLAEQAARLRPIAASMRPDSETARQVLTSIEALVDAYRAEVLQLDHV